MRSWSRPRRDPTVANFVKVVARNGRLFALPAIIAAFRDHGRGSAR